MRKFVLIFSCLLAMLSSSVQAETKEYPWIDKPAWELHLHSSKLWSSRLGQWVKDFVEDQDPEVTLTLFGFSEGIDFDVQKNIGEIVVFGDGELIREGMEEKNLIAAVVDLGKTTGNIEGWLLTAPGYQSEDLDEDTILHSLIPDIKDVHGKNEVTVFRVWLALPKDSRSQNYMLAASHSHDLTTRITERILDAETSLFQSKLEGNSIASLVINDLAATKLKIDKNKPGSSILRDCKSLKFTLDSGPDHLAVSLNLNMSSNAKARQVSQLVNGMKAMAQMTLEDESKFKEVVPQEVLSLADRMSVKHTEGESQVRIVLSASYEEFEKLAEVTGLRP